MGNLSSLAQSRHRHSAARLHCMGAADSARRQLVCPASRAPIQPNTLAPKPSHSLANWARGASAREARRIQMLILIDAHERAARAENGAGPSGGPNNRRPEGPRQKTLG